MGEIERRAIALGITEQAVDALVGDQGRPLLERVCDFAEGVLANNRQAAKAVPADQPAGAVVPWREIGEAIQAEIGGRNAEDVVSVIRARDWVVTRGDRR